MIHGALASEAEPSLRLEILPKDSTRPHRSNAEEAEYDHISRSEFTYRSTRDTYMASYHLFGESYGIRWDQASENRASSLLIQTVPTDIANMLKRQLLPHLPVYICLLDTPPEVARERLLMRADPGTLASLEARMSTALRDRHTSADFVVPGGRPAMDELTDFVTWLSSVEWVDRSTERGTGVEGV